MRSYELCLILHPDITENDINAVLDRISETVTKHGSAVLKTDKWGKKSLKYQIKKYTKAQYIFLYFNGTPDVLSDIDRVVRYNEHVLRYNFIRLAAPPELAQAETSEAAPGNEEAAEENTETAEEAAGAGKSSASAPADEPPAPPSE